MDLTKWENYKGLPSEQEEDLYQIFITVCKLNNLQCYEDVLKFFTPGSDTFVKFLNIMEGCTTWFDYTQMDEIFDELSLYLEQLNEDDFEDMAEEFKDDEDDKDF